MQIEQILIRLCLICVCPVCQGPFCGILDINLLIVFSFGQILIYLIFSWHRLLNRRLSIDVTCSNPIPTPTYTYFLVRLTVSFLKMFFCVCVCVCDVVYTLSLLSFLSGFPNNLLLYQDSLHHCLLVLLSLFPDFSSLPSLFVCTDASPVSHQDPSPNHAAFF